MKTAACAALLLLTPLPQEQATLPDAEAVLDRMRDAIGAAHLPKDGNVSLHGKVTWEGLPEPGGLLTEVYAGLRKARLTTEFGPFGEFESGADGDLVWEKNALETVIRDGWTGSQQLREFGIAQHVEWREMYSRAWCSGTKEIDGRRCWELQLAPLPLVPVPESSKEIPPPDLWYVDVESSLPRRYVAKALGLFDEPVIETIEVDDWRRVDGVLYPHRVELEVSGFTMIVTYDSIQHGVELAPGFFAPDDTVRAAVEDARTGDAAARDQAIVVSNLHERHLASIRVTVPRADLQKTLSVLLPETMQHVLSTGVAMDGPPLVRYHDWSDPVDLEAGIPVASAIEPKGRVKATLLPAGDAVIAWHVGPYEKLGETHERVKAYMESHGLEARGSMWEEYWTDPGMEPDPARWRTKVVWPVKRKGGGR